MTEKETAAKTDDEHLIREADRRRKKLTREQAMRAIEDDLRRRGILQ